MKKRRLLAIIALVVFAIGGVFFYKNNTDGYVDGVYYCEGSEYDKQGWKPILTITIDDKKIVDVAFDYINKDDGSLKTENAFYNKLMLSAVDMNPSIFTKEFAVELLVKQNVDDFDGISGASTSAKEFQVMAEKLLSNAKVGKTDKEIVNL